MTTSTITGTPWYPIDEHIYLDSQQELLLAIENEINELKNSQFYHDFRDELQSSPISKHIRRVLGQESKMQMVIYGIGSILKHKTPILQLSLAILMKKDFTWIGEVEVFDPILSNTEIEVLESLGCSVLYLDENGRRQAMKPTMFFMPHCDITLYNNLLEANWNPKLLSNVIIFGNSFDMYIRDLFSRDPTLRDTREKLDAIWALMGHILTAQTFKNEFRMRIMCHGKQAANRYEASLYSLSWHFFKSLTMRKMQVMKENTMEEYGVSTRRNEILREGGLFVLSEKRNQKARILATSSHNNNNKTLMAAVVLFTCIYSFHPIKTRIPSDEMAESKAPTSCDLSSAITIPAL